MENNGEEPSQPVYGEMSPAPEPTVGSVRKTDTNNTRWFWQGKTGPAFRTITDAPANIVLPASTELPIALNFTVPVSKIGC
jgi:hypothetical protein